MSAALVARQNMSGLSAIACSSEEMLRSVFSATSGSLPTSLTVQWIAVTPDCFSSAQARALYRGSFSLP